jgi:peptidoglycan/LPS O-acetylase OafA/YrhL
MNPDTTSQSVPEAASGKRFVLVDALRGIAALFVLLHHLLFQSDLQKTLWLALPGWLFQCCVNGAFGVEIFFVLSGFVITHSLRNVLLTPRAVGNFMIRRQLRLDPPYWTMLTITMVAMYVEAHVAWIHPRPLPTWTDVAANYLYLQNLTGNFPLMGVSWTLCLEVQFYLVFILLLLGGKQLGQGGARTGSISAALVAGLGILSMMVRQHSHDAWFFQWWYFFAAGAFCYWAVNEERFRIGFIAFTAFFLGVAVVGGWYGVQDPKPMLIGWATVMLLYTAGRMGRLTSWLNFAPLQYLGRISYSLYLSHLLAAVYVLRIGYRLTNTNQPASILWFIVAGLVSIGVAHILYLTVERTSVRFAARFKTRGQRRATTSADSNKGLRSGIEELQNA